MLVLYKVSRVFWYLTAGIGKSTSTTVSQKWKSIYYFLNKKTELFHQSDSDFLGGHSYAERGILSNANSKTIATLYKEGQTWQYLPSFAK